MRQPRKKFAAEHARCASFFRENFSRHGTAAKVGRAYAELIPGGDATAMADTFRDYRLGKRLPQQLAWDVARAIRAGTEFKWCAGPVMLFACSAFTELVWLFNALDAQAWPELVDLIGCLPYTIQGEDAAERPEVVLRARKAWTLNDQQNDALQTAWRRLDRAQSVTDFKIDMALYFAQSNRFTMRERWDQVEMCLIPWALGQKTLRLFLAAHPEYEFNYKLHKLHCPK
jgi:hypothetical protein